jgi:hypothetical protein
MPAMVLHRDRCTAERFGLDAQGGRIGQSSDY